MRTITFNELRKIKDSLPSGSMHRIADELGLHVDTVRNFFGGHNFKEGKSVGIHLEPGPDGGLVMLDDTTVLDRALKCKFKIQQNRIPIEQTIGISYLFTLQNSRKGSKRY
ncbi:DNA-binding protein [Bacteroides acidifaciens]|nr:DNA-binding protein [Bacteroides acidifaciens]